MLVHSKSEGQAVKPALDVLLYRPVLGRHVELFLVYGWVTLDHHRPAEDAFQLFQVVRLMRLKHLGDFRIDAQQNILISGGTGTGKTTLLNALAALIPDRDRIVVIEETAEIHLEKPNLLRMEARRAQAPLGHEAPLPPVTIADLLRATLRHRPDRVLVGEVRGSEAFDLLQALNTGHLGSLSTIHANSPEQALVRLAHCVLTANVGLPHHSIREAIALAIHLVVHLARVDSHRRVTGALAVRGYESTTDRFHLDSVLTDTGASKGMVL